MTGIQNFGCEALEPIFTKELVFELDVKHVFHGIELFKFKPPGGQSGMEQSNHSMFPSE
jgi:hypothetical protein